MNPAPELADDTETIEQEKDAADVPKNYRSETTSDLTAEVKEGTNEFNFDMKPE